LVVALLSATHYCCHSSHAVMRSPTLLSPAAFAAFAAPVVGWSECRISAFLENFHWDRER
jgi:hypothetical protein